MGLKGTSPRKETQRLWLTGSACLGTVGMHDLRGSISQAAITAKSPVLGGNGATVDQLAVSKCGFGIYYGVDMKHPAGQAWLDSVYGQYAEWGLDL